MNGMNGLPKAEAMFGTVSLIATGVAAAAVDPNRRSPQMLVIGPAGELGRARVQPAVARLNPGIADALELTDEPTWH